MLLVDTSQYPAKDRSALIIDQFSDPASGYFAPAGGDDLTKMQMRFRTWDMGDGCDLLNVQTSSLLIGQRPPRFAPARGRHRACWCRRAAGRAGTPGRGRPWVCQAPDR